MSNKSRKNKKDKVIATLTLSILAMILMIASGIAVTPIAATTITTTPASQSGSGSNIGFASNSSGLMSDLNFSEFSGFNNSDSSEDFSSLLSSFMTDVNGTYVNPSIGFQIDLPTGWKGKEINFLINSVFVAPEEINNLLELEGEEAFQNLSTLMTVVGMDEETFDMIEGFSELATLGGGEGGISEEDTLLQDSEPLDTTTPFGNNVLSCTFSQPSFVTINNINAEERSGECIDQEGGGMSPKTKSYTFATQNNSLIVVGFYGNSTITYNQHLPLFEESVRTINISQPADIATSEIYNRYKELVQSQVSNQTAP